MVGMGVLECTWSRSYNTITLRCGTTHFYPYYYLLPPLWTAPTLMYTWPHPIFPVSQFGTSSSLQLLFTAPIFILQLLFTGPTCSLQLLFTVPTTTFHCNYNYFLLHHFLSYCSL